MVYWRRSRIAMMARSSDDNSWRTARGATTLIADENVLLGRRHRIWCHELIHPRNQLGSWSWFRSSAKYRSCISGKTPTGPIVLVYPSSMLWSKREHRSVLEFVLRHQEDLDLIMDFNGFCEWIFLGNFLDTLKNNVPLTQHVSWRVTKCFCKALTE